MVCDLPDHPKCLFLEQLTAFATLHYSSITDDFNERIHVLAAQPLPFRTPTDLLDVHDTLGWWFISYLAACSNTLSPDTFDSEGVSSSLLGKGNSRRDDSPVGLSLSLWCSLAQRSTIFWCLGKYLSLRPASLSCVLKRLSQFFSTKKSTRNHMNVGTGDTLCLTQREYMSWAAFQQLQFLLLGSSPRFSNTPHSLFFGFFAPRYQNTDLG